MSTLDQNIVELLEWVAEKGTKERKELAAKLLEEYVPQPADTVESFGTVAWARVFSNASTGLRVIAYTAEQETPIRIGGRVVEWPKVEGDDPRSETPPQLRPPVSRSGRVRTPPDPDEKIEEVDTSEPGRPVERPPSDVPEEPEQEREPRNAETVRKREAEAAAKAEAEEKS